MFSRMNAKQEAAAAAAAKEANFEDEYYNIYTVIDSKYVLLRCYEKDGPVFASSETGEIPGTFAIWKFTTGSQLGNYRFTSYAFDSEITAELEVGAQITVSSKREPVQFLFRPSHEQDIDDIYVIRAFNHNLVWTIAKDGDKRAVTLQKADGSQYQDFKVRLTKPCGAICSYE